MGNLNMEDQNFENNFPKQASTKAVSWGKFERCLKLLIIALKLLDSSAFWALKLLLQMYHLFGTASSKYLPAVSSPLLALHSCVFGQGKSNASFRYIDFS